MDTSSTAEMLAATMKASSATDLDGLETRLSEIWEQYKHTTLLTATDFISIDLLGILLSFARKIIL